MGKHRNRAQKGDRIFTTAKQNDVSQYEDFIAIEKFGDLMKNFKS